jgi:DNA mismatch repair protein MutS2
LLIDEFGSGTEPQIGGALAEALLERFNQKKAYGIITTHYQNLKHYAEATPGIVNAAMLYDRHLMKPLFQLSIGRPGSSFAVEIARKTGLPDEVIRKASETVGSDYINMDKYLQDIVRDKRYWETKRDNIRRQEKKIEELTARYEHNLEDVDKQRKEIIRNAKAEAARLIAETNARIENTIREIKETQAEKEKTRLARQALEEFKASAVADNEDDDKVSREIAKIKNRQTRKKHKPTEPQTSIAPGDAVRIDGQPAVGSVLSLQGDEATIALGMIKSTVKLNRLTKVSRSQLRKEEKKNTFVSEQTMETIREKRLNFKQDIDVRGMRGDEALQAVIHFVDDAVLFGVSPVRILHGTGTGALRQIIRDYLSSARGVRRYHDEHVQLGGAGITVIEL